MLCCDCYARDAIGTLEYCEKCALTNGVSEKDFEKAKNTERQRRRRERLHSQGLTSHGTPYVRFNNGTEVRCLDTGERWKSIRLAALCAGIDYCRFKWALERGNYVNGKRYVKVGA